MKTTINLDPVDFHVAPWHMHFSSRTKRLMIAAGITLAAACAVIPIHNRMFQAGFFAGILLAWLGIFAMQGRIRKLALWLCPLPLLALLPFALPDKEIDRNLLRGDYVDRLRAFDDTRYVWGGESPLGIDCSGLPRRALRDALWAEGLNHANGRAFRHWLDQWWHDTSALAMSQSYRGFTQPLGISAPLWGFDESKLLPGDLAIKDDGHHVVVFLGNHQWIEADPTSGKVHIWTPSQSNGYYYENMTAHRWTVCDQ